MKHLTAILLICLASCAPRAIVVRPISEQAAATQGAVEVVSKQADKVERGTTIIVSNVETLRANLARAHAESERQRKAGQATQRELEANARSWSEARLKVEFLEATVATLQLDTSDLRTAINTAQIEAEKMRVQANAADDAAKKLQDRIIAMTPNYELGKTIRGMFWLLVIGGVLIVVALIVLIAMNRAARASLSFATRGVIPP